LNDSAFSLFTFPQLAHISIRFFDSQTPWNEQILSYLKIIINLGDWV